MLYIVTSRSRLPTPLAEPAPNERTVIGEREPVGDYARVSNETTENLTPAQLCLAPLSKLFSLFCVPDRWYKSFSHASTFPHPYFLFNAYKEIYTLHDDNVKTEIQVKKNTKKIEPDRIKEKYEFE